MPWILRRPEDRTNPTLAGGVYNDYITAGLGFFWGFTGSRVKFLMAISDGGKYGMDTSAIKISYKGGYISSGDYVMHPGTLTKQISPFVVTAVDTSANTVTLPGIGLANNDPIRFHVRGGVLPPGITTNKLYVYNKSGDTYNLSSTDPATTTTAVDITGAGSGTITGWKANAGWDDPVQGLPTYCPETKTTFSGICYVEGYLPSTYNTNVEPTWDDFRVEGKGRKLMNYDSSGATIGIVDASSGLLGNPALVAADVLLTEYKKPTSRLDWASWDTLKTASPTLVWERSDTTQAGRGLKTEYGTHAGSPTYTNPLFVDRTEGINFASSSAAPREGITATNFWMRWTGKIKFKYAETYQMKITVDDYTKLIIGGATIIDGTGGPATLTGNYVSPAVDHVATVEILFSQSTGPWTHILKWSAPSLLEEVVPVQNLFEPDNQIPLIEINSAFSTPTETSLVFEHVIGKCPGWEWTDKDGKVVFLEPDRAPIYDFIFDAEDDDADSNILEKSFTKVRRHRRDRRNFALYSYRRKIYTGYPEEFVEQDRPVLRERGNGMPNNDQPADLMVMHRGQAKILSDVDFKMTTDPTHDLGIAGRRGSGVITKNQYVTLKNWISGDRKIETSTCQVMSVERQGLRVSFGLLPIVLPLYTVEVV